MRRADSAADVFFYCCVAVVIAVVRPDVAARWWPAAVGLLAAEAMVQLIHFSRFKCPAAVHAWSAKIWGLILFAGVTALLAGTSARIWPWVIAGAGVVSYGELLAIVLLSPGLPVDVRGVWRVPMRTRRIEGVSIDVPSTPRA